MSKLICPLVLLLLAVPAFAQHLVPSLGNPAAQRLSISAQIAAEGSFELQRSAGCTNWLAITNFNSLPGTNILSHPRTNLYQFFRLVRLEIPASITEQPQGTTNFYDEEVRLEAGATGSWPLRFQWYKDGQAVSGATTNKLVFRGRANLSGNYHLVVSNLWGTQLTTTAAVKTVNPAASTISGKKVHFVVKGAQGNFIGTGTFDTNYDPQGFYYASSSSVFLVDSGYWQYWLVDGKTADIYMPGSVTYPDGFMRLIFKSQTNGTYTLQVPGRFGGQWGDFNFTN